MKRTVLQAPVVYTFIAYADTLPKAIALAFNKAKAGAEWSDSGSEDRRRDHDD